MSGERGGTSPGRRQAAAIGVLLVLVYVASAWLGNELGQVGSLTVWYPPAGLGLAGAILVGPASIPYLAVAELVTGAAVFGVDEHFSWLQLVVNAVGYAAIWGASGAIVRRVVGTELRRLAERTVFCLGVAMAASPLAAALWGISMQRWAGIDERPFLHAVGLWWTGDAVGATSVAPTVLVVAFAVRSRRRGVTYRILPDDPWWATLLALLSPVGASLAVFLAGSDEVRFPYLIFIPIVLVGLRYGVEGVAIATFGVTPVVTLLVEHLRPDVLDKAELQALLLVGIGIGIVVGAVTSERRRLGRMHQELSAVIEAIPDLVTIVDEGGAVTYLNPAARDAVGLGPDDRLDGLRDVDLAGSAVGRELTAGARAAALRDGSWRGEVVLRRADGREVIGSQVTVAQTSGDHGRRAASVVRDVTEQRRLERELVRGALHDDLTGLPNRTLLFDQLSRSLRRGEAVALLLVVVDRFAVITEGRGQRAGDAVVQAVAERVAAAVRPADIVGRLGGHSFAVVLTPGVEELELVATGDRLIAAASGPVELDGQRIPIAVRVGAVRSGPELTTPDELVRAAEVAAHRAAELGEDRTVLYSGGLVDRAGELLAIETELRDGIHSDRWALAYQPIVDLRSGRVVACEALIRWTGADGTSRSPVDVIGLAEETGLIVPLGEAVLERACRDAQRWAGGDAPIGVSVNMSARQLVAPSFVRSVASVLGRTGLDARLLTVELTETSFAGDVATIRPPLDAVHGLGVDIAMDDFGTGWSSLSQLSGLPITTVKLDKSFIDDLATSARSRQLVDGVITLAHALDVTVVAEGVESTAQVAVLTELGCDRAQGYRFARPLPLDELLEQLATRTSWIP